ncbi:MAG TPA: hypothetical protein VK879_06295 [Candidatus Sulfomarinibacteraceae bacterium]|nr:hypothetical protein [Candidatus Sulfomarinibacteraceae bacterium]
MMLRKKLYLIVLVLALVIPVTAVYAVLESVILKDGTQEAHQLDLVSKEDSEVDGVTHRTYTYALTDLNNVQNGVSHFVFGIETCYTEDFLVSPSGSSYLTPTNLDVCDPDDGIYDCVAAPYEVETGLDGSTGMTGLKFNIEDDDYELTNGTTHIFQITVKGFLGDGPVGALTKYGSTDTGGDETITGPVCPGPTAVTFSSSNVSSQSASALLPFVLLMGLGLATVSIIVWRRQVANG